MQHFSDESWLNFVRLPADSSDYSDLKRHLDEGCVECHGVWRTWQTVGRLLRREESFKCPNSVLAGAGRIWTEWRQRSVIPKRARMARLIFDSILEPLAAGVRGSAETVRRVVALQGPWSVDLRLEADTRRMVSLEGQIFREPSSGSLPENIEILVLGEAGKAEHTETNPMGEFHLRYQAGRSAKLYVIFPSRRPIGVDLPDVDSLVQEN